MADLAFTATMLFWMFIGSLVVGGFSTILLLMVVAWTPALAFLKAKLKKMPLLAARRRDRKIHYIKADQYVQGLATNKEYGGFLIDSDSVFTEQKSGVPILPVNSEIGITLSEKVLRMIDGLKRMGINNIEEAEALSQLYGKCECGYEGIMNASTITNEEGAVTGYDLECPYLITEDDNDVKVVKKEETPPVYVSAKDRKALGEVGNSKDGHADKGPGKDI